MENQVRRNSEDITDLKVDVGVLKTTVQILASSVNELKKMHEDVMTEMGTLVNFNKQLRVVVKFIVPTVIVVGIALGDKVKEIITSIPLV